MRPQQQADAHDRQEKQASIQKLEGVPQQIIKPVSISSVDTPNSRKDSSQTRSNTTAPVTAQAKGERPQSKESHEDPKQQDLSASESAESAPRTSTKSDISEGSGDDTEVKFRKGGKIGGKHVHAGRPAHKGGGKGKGNKGEKSGKERGKGQRGEKGKWGGKGK